MEYGKIIVQTEHLQLTEMQDSDREDVLRLLIQVNPTAALWDEKGGVIRDALRDAAWAEILNDTVNYIIRDMDGTFIGRVCMQHLSDECPEVGIELFEQYRNRGFGPEALSAFIAWYKATSGQQRIKARIEQDNAHSQHVFKKLGAVYDTNDTALREATIRRLKEVLPEADISDLKIRDIQIYYL